MEINRRDIWMGMAAFVSISALADAQVEPAAAAKSTGSPAADYEPVGVSRVFRLSEMPVSQNQNGGWSRSVMHGTLPTGEFVEVHQTMLPPGQMPHPPHHHRNTEFILPREGKLEYLNAGKPETVDVGDVIYTASDQMHGLKNVGEVPALYYVVSISHGQL